MPSSDTPITIDRIRDYTPHGSRKKCLYTLEKILGILKICCPDETRFTIELGEIIRSTVLCLQGLHCSSVEGVIPKSTDIVFARSELDRAIGDGGLWPAYLIYARLLEGNGRTPRRKVNYISRTSTVPCESGRTCLR
ncbi:hypothetical protein GMORB2_3695 [Geosmithia morbida]|uniref:Uncharacterized protein n=1 Tax=Geosmithia morbida TaxID=1094350 RepID=A0A9P4YZX4_9HYPO|nr:uncharacterized protein GMORB2_3695 [Geosmithia morbida]KAF4124856.1 hypothetical protein GMORB2_3695 [Geosmithia morbida]